MPSPLNGTTQAANEGALLLRSSTFLKGLPQGSVVAVVGCGDDKHFSAIDVAGSYVIGSHVRRSLLQTAFAAAKNVILQGSDSAPESRCVGDTKVMLDARPAVAVANCMHIPIRAFIVDAAICSRGPVSL